VTPKGRPQAYVYSNEAVSDRLIRQF
jgi:hypothetical protein